MQQRRKFLKKTGMALAAMCWAPTIIPASAMGRDGYVAPSDRINLAFIGAGNQAENDVKGFLRDERVQVTTICDVNKQSTGYWNGKVGGRAYISNLVNEHYSKDRKKPHSGVVQFEDFREVLQITDIDAVEIVTPDHWHAIPVMMAAAAKKDIYCQKPLSLTIQEGRDMAKAVEKSKVIFQTGSQQRSNQHFRHACELVRNGRIGKLEKVVCGLPGGTPDFGKTGHLTEVIPVPKDFNYDLWLGPAAKAPYCPARTHVNFRWILDYSGGMVTDWGGHHPDIAQWGMDTERTGPIKVIKARGTWADHPVWNTATSFYFECLYANGITLVITDDAKHGVTFEGSEGSIWANRRDSNSDPASLIASEISENEIRLYRSDDHYRNFIDCIISREAPIAPVEVAHRSITLAHLGNIAMQLNKDLDWDPVREEFINNSKANAMLKRPMRAPWDQVYSELAD
ncbi:MAG: Gfo/Idh/MocA family oxidoreductase [Saprospiraceae bacterium]|nr:Gfo/Idh/MocA family oxidoreductase [Saprospiraceae bacterium]